jgi:hypothetical protein
MQGRGVQNKKSQIKKSKTKRKSKNAREGGSK